MKKTRKLMALSLVAAMIASGSLSAVASTETQDVLSVTAAKSSGISTFAAQGKFLDYFPNPVVAKAVAAALNKSVDDTVTLSELMSNVTTLSIHDVDRLDNIDGLEYLFSLKRLHFYNIPNGINFKDTLNFSKNLDLLEMRSVNNTELPEGLINSGIKHYKISFSYNSATYGPQWNVKIPQKLIEQMNQVNQNGYKMYNVLLGFGTGKSDIVREYEIGSKFDSHSLFDPFIQSLIDIEDVQNVHRNFALEIRTQPGYGTTPLVSMRYERGKYNNMQAFLNDFNQTVESKLKEAGDYYLAFNTIGINDTYYLMPLHVTQAPLAKQFGSSTTANNGADVRFDGVIAGHFVEGVNSLGPAELAAQHVRMMYNQSYINDIQPHILGCTVTVKNAEIISITIAGFAEVGNPATFFMLTSS